MATTYGSVQFLALRLLPYWGITSLATSGQSQITNVPGIQPTDKDDLAAIITGVMQEIFDDAPSDLSEQQLSCNLHGPTSLTLAVTNGSASATASAGWADWMLGCRCDGADGFLNEIVGYAAGAVTLLRPFNGTTGTVAFTIYQDAIRLDSNAITNLASGLTVRNVLDPVELQGRRIMIPDGDRATFYNRGGFLPYAANAILVSEPSHYFVDSRYDPATASLPLYLRIAPAPGQFWPVTFRAKLCPKVFTATDIGSDTTDPNTIIPMPAGTLESIVLPYCRQAITGHSAFKNSSVIPEIARAYEKAKGMLLNRRPGISTGTGNNYPFGLR